MTEYFVTRSGLPVRILYDSDDRNPPSGDERVAFRLFLDGSTRSCRVIIHLKEVTELKKTVEQASNVDWSTERQAILFLAVLANSELASVQVPSLDIPLEPADAMKLLKQPPMSDPELRVFVARRVYDTVSRSALRDPVKTDPLDARICGVSPVHLLRAAQVLEEEGYLGVYTSTQDTITIIARASLIRDIERYGAPKADSTMADDLLAALASYPIAKQRLPAIRLEYGRFTSATTQQELISVYKAIAPELEGLVRDVLAHVGGKPSSENLGQMIAELQSRRLASLSIVSQLRHVHKFARDMAEHGESLPDPVLRIACANAFAVMPAIAALAT